MKTCTKCGIPKELSEFTKEKLCKGGIRPDCNKCRAKIRNLWVDATREERRAYAKKWLKNNPDKKGEYYRKSNARIGNTVKGKLVYCMKGGIRRSLRNSSKEGRMWESLVGYTWGDLKRHIEKQFILGMSWENYGPVWHIDHKIPISAFNFSSPEDIDFKRCWSLKNLQPLWANDNVRKQDKLISPFQPSLLIKSQGV